MVTFRKSLLLLAVIVMAAAVASAQTTPAFQCTANAGVPPLIRAEGLTELAGDVVLNCTGGTPTLMGQPVPQVNFRVMLNTNVTSWLVDGGTASEALLMIDDPQPGNQLYCPQGASCPVTGVGGEPGVDYSQTYNIWQGTYIAPNQIEWLGVPVDPPGTRSTRIIRITNVRVNAVQLGVGGGLIPSQVIMFISATGPASVPINNPQQIVGYVQDGLSFSASGSTHLQCEDPKGTSSVEFDENFATAFMPRGGVQNVPGQINNTETGFYSPSAVGENGHATTGTRLMAHFTNIPAGVAVSVSNQMSDNGTIAQLVTGVNADGSGGSVTSGGGSTQIISSGGDAVAVWEVVAGNPTTVDSLVATVSFSWTPNTQAGIPGLGSGTVEGNYAPLSSWTTAVSTDMQPRFVDDDTSSYTIITINSCMTNLLFPYITNEAGFDTGMVVANTSLDPFGTAPQSGPCTIYYYGNVNGGPGTTTMTTPSVAGGEYAVWTLSSGGGVRTENGTVGGINGYPGFNGYAIVRCDFQYAHGYAFISDLGAQKLAQGYLALVLDESIFACDANGAVKGEGGYCMHAGVGSRTGSKSEPLNQ